MSAIVRLPWLARSLPDRLATHTAALHAIDPGAVPSTGTFETYLAHLEGNAHDLGRADLAAVADWLADHRPSGGRTVVCHGDLHPFNVLTDPSGDTVLDWSSARTTDPAYDIAYTTLLLANPPLATPRFLAPIIGAAGRALARRFRRTYDQMAEMPVDPGQLGWFSAFHSLRVLFEVASWGTDDGLDSRPGHPFFDLAPVLAAQLTTTTTVAVSAG